MTNREKLIKLLDDIGAIVDVPIKVDEDGCGDYSVEGADYIADYLLANGVIVPPCKVDDIVYYIYGKNVEEDSVHSIYIDCWNELSIKLRGQRKSTKLEECGKTVHLTKEEAEKALENLKNTK